MSAKGECIFLSYLRIDEVVVLVHVKLDPSDLKLLRLVENSFATVNSQLM